MLSLSEIEKTINELESQGTTFANCERLAWLYIVRDNIKDKTTRAKEMPVTREIYPVTESNSEFLQVISGKDTKKIWDIMNEVMDTIQTLHPKMYKTIINKIKDI